MTASNVSRFENVWRWFLDVEPSERKHTPRNKIAQIHLDGGDDYLDCDLLICCTTVWLDATDARVSPPAAGRETRAPVVGRGVLAGRQTILR